jgi:hypothetical protein
LNLGRTGAVEQTKIKVHDGTVNLNLVPRQRMGVDLELWAVEKERNYFREVLGRELSVAAV